MDSGTCGLRDVWIRGLVDSGMCGRVDFRRLVDSGTCRLGAMGTLGCVNSEACGLEDEDLGTMWTLCVGTARCGIAGELWSWKRVDSVMSTKSLLAVADRSQHPLLGMVCLLAYYTVRAPNTEKVQCRRSYTFWAAMDSFLGFLAMIFCSRVTILITN